MLSDDQAVSWTYFGLAVTPKWSTKRSVTGGTVVDIDVHDKRSTITCATVNVANLKRVEGDPS
jgi:hypothetical protein